MSPTGTTVAGSRRGSTEHQSSAARCWARAERDRELVVAVAVEAQDVRARERVEHELAREPEVIERAGTVVVQERTGREEVLAQRDLRRVVGAVLGIAVHARSPSPPRRSASCPRRPIVHTNGNRSRVVASRYGCSQSAGSMMCESASCIGRVAYGTPRNDTALLRRSGPRRGAPGDGAPPVTAYASNARRSASVKRRRREAARPQPLRTHDVDLAPRRARRAPRGRSTAAAR